MMDWDLYTGLIDQIAHERPVINLHHSGEPLLHNRIHDMVRYAQERGAFVGYFTNAIKMDAKARKAILDSPPNWLGFSIDGYDKKTYESVRIRGKWDVAIGNVERLLQERRERNQRMPYTYLSTVELPGVASGNIDESRAAFRAHMRSLGLDQISIANTHNWAGSIDWLGGEVSQQSRCPFPWTGLGILWDGTVVPCCMDMDVTYPVGKLPEQSLREVWNSDAMRVLRVKLANKQAHEIPLCKDCDVLNDRAYFGVPSRVWQELMDVALAEHRTRAGR
jgi:radical SAM protein with 4Fe4S-binding SPASM domain